MGKIITLVNSSEMIKMMCICFSNSAKYTQWLKIIQKVSFYIFAKEQIIFMKIIFIFEIEMRHFLVVFKLICKMFTRLCRGLFFFVFSQ